VRTNKGLGFFGTFRSAGGSHKNKKMLEKCDSSVTAVPSTTARLCVCSSSFVSLLQPLFNFLSFVVILSSSVAARLTASCLCARRLPHLMVLDLTRALVATQLCCGDRYPDCRWLRLPRHVCFSLNPFHTASGAGLRAAVSHCRSGWHSTNLHRATTVPVVKHGGGVSSIYFKRTTSITHNT
jgi:hypothetical protein